MQISSSNVSLERSGQANLQASATHGQHLLTCLFGFWLMVGLFIDGYYHNQPTKLESFFTPWHAIFYSGYLVVALWMGFLVLSNLRAGYRGARAIPVGYELGVAGVLLFGVGGLMDLIWHTIFGIEQDSNALFSPVHLWLVASGTLVLSSPLRAAWRLERSDAPGWRAFAPTFVSWLTSFSFITFIEQWLWGLLTPTHAKGYFGMMFSSYEPRLLERAGILQIFFTGILVSAAMLYVLRRFRPPFGAFTLFLGLNTVLMGAIIGLANKDQIAVGFIAGFLIDLLTLILKPSSSRPVQFYTWAFLAPIVLWSVHFAIVFGFVGGTLLPLEKWTGAIFSSGLFGLLVAGLLLQPVRQDSGSSVQVQAADD